MCYYNGTCARASLIIQHKSVLEEHMPHTPTFGFEDISMVHTPVDIHHNLMNYVIQYANGIPTNFNADVIIAS